MRRHCLLAVVLSILATGWTTLPTSSALAATLELHKIKPSLTDPLITERDEPSYLYISTDIPHVDKLFLYLPGSFTSPSKSTLILQTAAHIGYHAIGLGYMNKNVVGKLCDGIGDTPGDQDPNCTAKVRLEKLDGVDRTPLVSVDRTNSVENRLVKLLQYVDLAYPTEGWGQFLDADTILWDKIVVSGHSQGGGMAAIIGKQHLVMRAVSFSSPGDLNPVIMGPNPDIPCTADVPESSRRPAPWIIRAGATPPSRYYGMVHDLEAGETDALTNWGCLGMRAFGDPVQVGGGTSDFGGSHQLLATLPPAPTDPGNYHGSTAIDKATPILENGTPAYSAAWTYLLQPVE